MALCVSVKLTNQAELVLQAKINVYDLKKKKKRIF